MVPLSHAAIDYLESFGMDAIEAYEGTSSIHSSSKIVALPIRSRNWL